MKFEIMINHLINQGAVFTAKQSLSEIFSLIASKKVEWYPDEGLVLRIPVIQDLYLGGELSKLEQACYRFRGAEYPQQPRHQHTMKPWR